MTMEMLYSKLHRATVTDANLNYVGSITIDEELLEASKMRVGQKVEILNIFSCLSKVSTILGIVNCKLFLYLLEFSEECFLKIHAGEFSLLSTVHEKSLTDVTFIFPVIWVKIIFISLVICRLECNNHWNLEPTNVILFAVILQ